MPRRPSTGFSSSSSGKSSRESLRPPRSKVRTVTGCGAIASSSAREELVVLLLGGHRRALLDEEELAAVEPDAAAAERAGVLDLLQQLEVGQELDLDAVEGARRERPGLDHRGLVALDLAARRAT